MLAALAGDLAPVELPSGRGFLEACYAALGCRLVDCVALEDEVGEAGRGILAWTDDEGLLSPAAGYWMIRSRPAVYAGRVLFTGELRGETAPLLRSAEDVGRLVEMYGARLSFDFSQDRTAVSPGVVRTL